MRVSLDTTRGLRLGGTEDLRLLLAGLEATVAKLGRSIDELERNLLGGNAARLLEERLAHGDQALARTDDATLDHDVIALDNTVVREATHRGNFLFGEIVEGGGTVVGIASLANLVHLLVDFGTVVVTVLTSAGNRVRNTGRVPGTDARNLAQTTVGLTREAGDTPTSDDTFETLTLRNADEINHFILLEDGVNRDSLFEEGVAEVNLGGDVATVDLDFHDVRLLLLQALDLADLGVSDDADDVAGLLEFFEVLFDGAARVVLGVLGESLLLGLEPVLVEATLDFVVQVLSPDSLLAAQALRGADVADEADDDEFRALDDGDGFASLLLVELGARLVDITDDVRHTSLEAHEGGEVRRLAGIILREGLHLTARALGALLRQEAKVTETRVCRIGKTSAQSSVIAFDTSFHPHLFSNTLVRSHPTRTAINKPLDPDAR